MRVTVSLRSFYLMETINISADNRNFLDRLMRIEGWQSYRWTDESVFQAEFRSDRLPLITLREQLSLLRPLISPSSNILVNQLWHFLCELHSIPSADEIAHMDQQLHSLPTISIVQWRLEDNKVDLYTYEEPVAELSYKIAEVMM